MEDKKTDSKGPDSLSGGGTAEASCTKTTQPALLEAVLEINKSRRDRSASQSLELYLLEIFREYCRETLAAGGACPICAGQNSALVVNERVAA